METVSLAYDEFEGVGGEAPIILIHGFLWSKYMFREVARSLAKETKRKVFSVDLRNHGESPSCLEVGAHLSVEDIKRFLDERKLQRVVFVTHSMSSTFAYMIALEQPDRVERLVMIDHVPVWNFKEEFARRIVVPQCEMQYSLLKRIEQHWTLKEGQNKLLALAQAAPSVQKSLLTKFSYDLVKRDGMFAWKHDVKFLTDQYMRRVFSPDIRASCSHPILIVRCDDSFRVTDEIFKSVLKDNPNARLETIKNTTHLLMLEKTETFSKMVADFLVS